MRWRANKGMTYWFNLTPQCTNSANPDCTGGYFFESDTDGLNGVNGNLQPKYQAYFSSSYFGYTCSNVCDLLGGQGSGCIGMSYALAGHQ